MGRFGGVVLALGAWAVLAATSSAAGADLPAFLCAPAKVAKDGTASASIGIADRFATRELTLASAASACWAEAPATLRLEGYATRVRPRKARRVGATVTLVTRLGRESLAVKALDELRVPSSGDGSDPGAGPLACYAVRRDGRGAPRVRVAIADGTGEHVYDVGRATRLCVPASGDPAPELVCHAIRLARTKPLRQPAAPATTLTLTNRFGTDALRVHGARELCVPVLGASGPGPGADPPFTLSITPGVLSAIAGAKPRLAATASFDDGHTENYTGAVVWSSSDETVARIASSSATGAFLETVGPGTAVISAVDPVTGVGSADTGGNATVTVSWPLEKLIMAPHAVTKRPGDHEGYTVIGWFTGGFTRNLTQRVVYGSSDPAVAVAPNTPGNRSRIEALATGTTTIMATDPISGIGTAASGNDATLHVAGTLLYVTVSSNHGSRFPGESQRFTARGYFSDGSILNVTQQCAWSSSEPAVAIAPNLAGDRSRIDALSPGTTYVTCTDPASGQSGGAPFAVLGALASISVYGSGSPLDWIRPGGSLSLTAIGRYEGGGFRNVTQDVMWTSRDPEIGLATNEAGNRSRIIGVDGGIARVFATDLTSGISSGDVSVTVLGDLVGLEIIGTWDPTVLPVDAMRFFPVRGIFDGGTLNLTSTRLASYTLESSDPSVLEVVGDVSVHAVAPGIADLTARDVATGVTSPPVPIRVKGGLDHITLTPATATRGIGEWESFTAVGSYLPDLTELLTQRLTYGSSDESVAVADNAPFMRSRVRTVGAGTATITATDPLTGLSAAATLTVLPGTIERVTIEPATVVRNPGNDFSFTAIGHYPDGSTINVTQVVTWTSLAPDVATATNEAGDRSRIVGTAVGVAGVTALHPSGVGSHDSGDDATFVVKPLVGLTLTPGNEKRPLGLPERYTLVGTFDDATTINLTQDAYYWTDDPSIARADDLEGDRSVVELLAPGFTTVHARFTDWSQGYPVSSGSVAGAFLAVVP